MDFQQISTLFLNKSVKGSYISVLRKSQSIYINAEAISPRRLYKLLIKTFCIGSRSGWQCHLLSRAYANFAQYICCDILTLAHFADSKGTDSRSSGEVFLFISEGFLLVSKSRLRHLTTAKSDVPCFALCRAKEKIGYEPNLAPQSPHSRFVAVCGAQKAAHGLA